MAIIHNAGLVRKIALPHELLVYAAVSGSYAVHGIGFLFVLGVLAAFGTELYFRTLPVVILLLALLFMLTLGLDLVLAALQVFFNK